MIARLDVKKYFWNALKLVLNYVVKIPSIEL